MQRFSLCRRKGCYNCPITCNLAVFKVQNQRFFVLLKIKSVRLKLLLTDLLLYVKTKVANLEGGRIVNLIEIDSVRNSNISIAICHSIRFKIRIDLQEKIRGERSS